MKTKQSWAERIKKRNKLGFSLVELVVVIAILAIMTAVLAPTLLSYTERSRAQKDVSAMDEVTNAVFLSMTDTSVYDELVLNSLKENVSCYIDTNDEADHEANMVITKKVDGGNNKYTFNDNSRLLDETKYYAAGNMRGVTITFSPNADGSGYTLADGIVNEFLTDGATKLIDMPYVYNTMRQAMGDKIELTSQTYRNSDYTIFIKIGTTGGNQADAQDAIEAYGQYSGTNLPMGDIKYYVAYGRQVDKPEIGTEPVSSGGTSGFPIEWNSMTVAGNATFVFSDMPFIKVAEFTPSAAELTSSEMSAMETTIPCAQAQDMEGFTFAVYDESIFTFSVTVAGEYADLGISFPETGFYVLDFGSLGLDADFMISPPLPTLDTPVVSLSNKVLTITPVENAIGYEIYVSNVLICTTAKMRCTP